MFQISIRKQTTMCPGRTQDTSADAAANCPKADYSSSSGCLTYQRVPCANAETSGTAQVCAKIGGTQVGINTCIVQGVYSLLTTYVFVFETNSLSSVGLCCKILIHIGRFAIFKLSIVQVLHWGLLCEDWGCVFIPGRICYWRLVLRPERLLDRRTHSIKLFKHFIFG